MDTMQAIIANVYAYIFMGEFSAISARTYLFDLYYWHVHDNPALFITSHAYVHDFN